MATLRFYLDDIARDFRNRYCVAMMLAGVDFVGLMPAIDIASPWCLVAVIADDHAPIAALPSVDALPDLPLDTPVDSALRYQVAAMLQGRGVDPGSLGWLDDATVYRDLINGIPVNYQNWDSYNADAYLPG